MHAEVETFIILESYESVTCVTGVRNHGNFRLGDSQAPSCVIHGRSADSGADQCDAMPCEMTNGTGSKILCQAVRVTWGLRRRTIGCLWRPSRFSSAAFPIPDDLLHRNILLLRAMSG